MKLMTKEIRKKLKPRDEVEEKDPLIVVKYFDPMGSWKWFAYAGEDWNDTVLLTGVVKGFEVEEGDFALSELEDIGKKRILGIERDLYFKPIRLSELMDKLNAGAHV